MIQTLLSVDWHTLFIPSNSLLEIIIRGTFTYLGIFIILRVILKRESGGLAMSDVLVVVLLADAAQNAMAGEYQSITEGLCLVLTIIIWSYIIDWLAYRFPHIERFLSPKKLPLVENGHLIRKNMRKEFITHDELMSEIRLNGAENLNEVERVYLEPDGQISVILKN